MPSPTVQISYKLPPVTPISQKKLSKVLTTLQDVLEACPQVLIASEPGRLAAAILTNLSLGRLDQDQLVTWLPQLTVDDDDHLA